MPEPSKAELRLCSRLRLPDGEAQAFLQALREGKSSRQALVLTVLTPPGYVPPFPCEDTASWGWLPPRVIVPSDPELKPGAFEDYRKGFYYPLDLSSAWESAALSVVQAPASCLDLCAAPGGKSMLMLARFPEAEHVANEVHPARRGILRDNLKQCGAVRSEVAGLRPDQWAREEGRSFDLILADAPCSGQSLLAKGMKNPGCLNAPMVNGNAKRQKGILLSVLPRLAPGGHVLYSTCTYDPEENEKVMGYLLKRYPDLSAVEVPCLAAFRSSLCGFPAYRLLPRDGFGAGGFCCLLHRSSSSAS